MQVESAGGKGCRGPSGETSRQSGFEGIACENGWQSPEIRSGPQHISLKPLDISWSLVPALPAKFSSASMASNASVITEMRTAFSQAPISIETRPGDGVLIITDARPIVSNQQFQFHRCIF
jgi:hypothetical protein